MPIQTNRGWALHRAYVRGNRVKAMCRVCGKPIYNRLMYATDVKGTGYYAHQSCSKKDKAHNWEMTW